MPNIQDKLNNLTPEQREKLLQKARNKKASEQELDQNNTQSNLKAGDMDFSLIFFSGNGSSNEPNKYKLLIEAAKFADANGFSAVITPERHLQPVGGLFPNPSVLSSALAMVTDRIQLRAGSVIIPLHNPIRVAEEWSLVDNLSNGRAAISLATGWHPADYILAPELYEDRRQVTFDNVDLIRRLWEGEKVSSEDITGNPVEIQTLPRPIQPKLPMFLTSSGNPETWKKAGEMGMNVLCSLTNHSFESLQENINLYREARQKSGHAPQDGIVSTMVHTFVGKTNEEVKRKVKEPLRGFLNDYINQNDTLNPFKDKNQTVRDVIDNEREALINYAFEKHFTQTSMMGSKQKCISMVEKLHSLGVNEIACLIDFGLEQEDIMQGLGELTDMKSVFKQAQPSLIAELV